VSRAVRRQQAAPTKERAARPPRLTPGGGPRMPTRGARAPQEEKRRFRPRVPRWLDDIISELRKVTWPTADETRYLAGVVIIVALAVGAVLGLIDIFFNWVVDRLLLS
jgi:preprotein translocase subunit SecE